MGERGPDLLGVLGEARSRGFLGPGRIQDHVRHAEGFARAVGEAPARLLDLGAGGGVPGLVLLLAWPGTTGVLLDGSSTRARFLHHAVEVLDLGGRVDVVGARAEEAGRDSRWRGRFPVIVARSFGHPAVTAECASPFLCVGGRLVVSEPPASEDGVGEDAIEQSWPTAQQAPNARWPAPGLDVLGLEAGERRVLREGAFQVLNQRELCPDRFPRRTGVPAKRPLF